MTQQSHYWAHTLRKIRLPKDTWSPVPEALFTTARTREQPRCPSTDGWTWIKKLSYTMEYYSAITGRFGDWSSGPGELLGPKAIPCPPGLSQPLPPLLVPLSLASAHSGLHPGLFFHRSSQYILPGSEPAPNSLFVLVFLSSECWDHLRAWLIILKQMWTIPWTGQPGTRCPPPPIWLGIPEGPEVRNLPANAGDMGREDSPEKETATLSSILACRISRKEAWWATVYKVAKSQDDGFKLAHTYIYTLTNARTQRRGAEFRDKWGYFLEFSF